MSDTIIHAPFWTSVDEVPAVYPWLSKYEQCDVLIIGGGIAGALAAYRFSSSGIDTVLVSRSPVGFGTSAFSAGTMEYDNGLSLSALGKMIGKGDAVRCFQLFSEALDQVEAICKELPPEVHFVRRDCLNFSSEEEDEALFHTEYLMRRHNDFDVDYMEQSNTRESYSFPVRAGILSKGLAAELDPYFFLQALLAKAAEQGCRVYENTAVTEMDITTDHVVCNTATGRTVTAKKVIMATGCEQNEYVKVLAGKRSAFTSVTRPIKTLSGYDTRAILRDNDANVRIRTTPENRLIISGQDSSVVGANGKIANLVGSPKLALFRHGQLEQHLEEMFCGMDPLDYDYRFSAAYGYTADGLPVIGKHRHFDHLYFNMASGPDGILSAELASRLLLALYQGDHREEERLFSPNRKALIRRSMFS